MAEIRYDRAFDGIWIPSEIWLTPDLSLMEKVLFVEIRSLDNERGCFAGNKHFASFFGLSSRQITRHIISLKNKGLVSVTITNNSQRVIRVLGKYKRIPEAKLRELTAMRRDLAHQFSAGKLSTRRRERDDRRVMGV